MIIQLTKCSRHKITFFANREVPGTDVSSAADTDKENSMESEEEAENTRELLDSTFDVQTAKKLSFSVGPRSPLAPIFKTPSLDSRSSSADIFANESEADMTPIVRKKE